jgi:cytochrome P450
MHVSEQSDFYMPFGMRLDGKPLDSMFSTRDSAEHKHLKQPVAGSFALSSIRQLEPLVDECTDIFINEMAKRSPTPVDFSSWLQWYAFDVSGAITFLKGLALWSKGGT